jgi:hypothetical protein
VRVPLLQLERQFVLDPVGLRARLPHPVLVWEGPLVSPDAAEAWALTSSGVGSARPRAGETFVLSVDKHATRGNAFAMGVTLGRVTTNDVVVDDPSVSRFHAWFQLDARAGQWSVTDADSHNGTWHGGVKLAGKHPLVDGQTLVFGQVSMQFFTPEGFWRWLSARAGTLG